MEKKILNNKIGVQITVLLLGVALFVVGHVSMLMLPGIYAWFIIPEVITGFILIIVSSIKMADYCELKKHIGESYCGIKGNDSGIRKKEQYTRQDKTRLESIRNEIEYLKQMLDDGLINEQEYDEMRTELLKSNRSGNR